jgi:transitional endoplasmic reticulum ATPase
MTDSPQASSSSALLPPWAEELRRRYLAGESSLFLAHGNIRDVHPWIAEGGATEWLDVRRFLERFLARTRDVVVYYNVSQGLQVADKAQEKRLRRSVDARRALEGRPPLGALPHDSRGAVQLIEEVITDPLQTCAVILDYFETIAPSGDPSFLSEDDRATLVSIQRWSTDPAFLATDNLVILLTDQLGEVSRKVQASPQLGVISVPFADAGTRERFLRTELVTQENGTAAPPVPTEMPIERLAQITAGLTLLQIRALIRGARQTADTITFSCVSRRKKQVIEQECAGLVELVDPGHGFEAVGGMDAVKADLLRVANAVKEGQRNRVPMGMIFVGPMGTGKTFLAEAFAKESGLTCLKFKNFREKWVGSTEANLEKILDLVDALGYALLIIDEAERSLSSGESDGGTSSRVIARLKEYMSDTSHRGRVVILMMTNRPDLLDTDLKRPGRFDYKIPFFFPESAGERERILTAQAARARIALAPDAPVAEVAISTEGYSSAELEAVLLAAANLAAEAGHDAVGAAELTQAAQDVVPSRDTRMLDYMEMLAVFESSSRRMLPQRLAGLSTEDVHRRLDELRSILGRRAS